ncbi:MAG: cytochrome C [Epsilonproteobacteria bacterium]|nr:MAG: cytochrome C [Campylobacterota bacterium]
MKKLILSALFASVSLMAADGAFAPINGESLYQKHCAICHGEKGEQSPLEGVSPLAGWDAVKLALTIRDYRDQNDRTGAYTMHKNSQVMKDATVGLSQNEIVALAKYISALK